MTEGSPPVHESWIERQLREAAERGEFDGLEGAGEPLAVLEEPYESLWWVKRWIEREGISRADLAAELRRRSGRPDGAREV